MPSRPCLKCNQLTTLGSYCQLHQPKRTRTPEQERQRDERNPHRKTVKAPAWQRIRVRILKRDGYICQVCGGTRCGNKNLTVHHIVSRSDGGTDHDFNLQTVGERPCHQALTKQQTKEHK